MAGMSKPPSEPKLPPIALTMGDPAGIAPEITLKAWEARRAQAIPPFFVIGDPALYERSAKSRGISVKVQSIAASLQALDVFADALPVLPLTLAVQEVPGQLEAANAASVLTSIDKACELALQGDASALVTNPIHKAALYAAGFQLPGHTEYLAEKAGAKTPVMMLSCTGLRVVPVTVHRGLKDAIQELSSALILEKGLILARALREDFGLSNPRIAVAGLNPHAGEDGHFGDEEARVITPAVERLRQQGLEVKGPLSPDTMFHEKARASYDAALCMYHDQALIPVKTLGFEEGVNTTLGLPIVRTSPDHGTALDIAGKGIAHPGALIAAIKLAHEIALHRAGV